jgi:hypothetical protein
MRLKGASQDPFDVMRVYEPRRDTPLIVNQQHLLKQTSSHMTDSVGEGRFLLPER